MNIQKAAASLLSILNPPKERGPMTVEEEREDFIRRHSDQRSLFELQRQVNLQREKEENAVAEPKEEEFDFDKALAELEEWRKSAPKPEFDWEEFERDCKEEDEFEKGVPLYDFAEKKKSSQYEIRKKYGSKIAEDIWWCKQTGERVPKHIVAEMHRIHEGKPPLQKKTNVVPITPAISLGQKTNKVNWKDFKKKTDLAPTVFKNNRYSHVKDGIYNMSRKCRSLQNSTTLLLYLLQNRNWKRKKDKHDTYGTWYLKRNLVVASISVEKMCADLGVHEKTIRNWANALQKEGIIKKLKEGKENVYVLGEVVDGKELLYCTGEISCKDGPGSVH